MWVWVLAVGVEVWVWVLSMGVEVWVRVLSMGVEVSIVTCEVTLPQALVEGVGV